MEKEFVPYDLAVKLKELGFDEECLTKWGCTSLRFYENYKPCSNKDDIVLSGDVIAAPLWQQILDWFHKEYNLFAEFSFNTLRNKYDWCIPVNINKGYCSQEEYNTYEEARLECLKKLIEIIENEKL